MTVWCRNQLQRDMTRMTRMTICNNYRDIRLASLLLLATTSNDVGHKQQQKNRLFHKTYFVIMQNTTTNLNSIIYVITKYFMISTVVLKYGLLHFSLIFLSLLLLIGNGSSNASRGLGYSKDRKENIFSFTHCAY